MLCSVIRHMAHLGGRLLRGAIPPLVVALAPSSFKPLAPEAGEAVAGAISDMVIELGESI